MYCQKCGTENEDNATFCQNCGTRIKPKENKNDISKLINYKAILIGALVFFVLLVLIAVIILASGTTNMSGSPVLVVIVFGFVMIITGIITSFISGKEYSSGIINTTIISILYSILVGLLGGLYALIGGLMVFVVFGVIGSLIGVLIYRKNNNYNLTG
jgi:O-antigen/teichoic acid export membrane protein